MEVNPALMLGVSLLNNEEVDPQALLMQMAMMRNAQNLNPNARMMPGSTPAPMMANNAAPAQPTVVPMRLPEDKQQLLMTLKTNAEQAYPNNPIMQQVVMTQAIHESGLMGKPSQLATQNNNLFGIKGQGTAGGVNMPTQEFMNGKMQTINDGFAKNTNIADSFLQHRNLLNKPRYAPVLSAQSPVDAFTALQQSGYATDPAYANKLNNVYSRYIANLY